MPENTSSPPQFFYESRPIWLAGRATEMNLTAGFRALFTARGRATLRIAASTRYRVWLNGRFAGWGPTRGPHGHYRVDEWSLAPLLVEGENLLAIEVAGYNVNSYDLLDQPSFLQAELFAGGSVVAATGRDFAAVVLSERVQKVARYSFQRAFSEVYRLDPHCDAWRNDTAAAFTAEPVDDQGEKQLLPHHVPLPRFALRHPVAHLSSGRLEPSPPERLWQDRCFTEVGPRFKGYPLADLVTAPFFDVQRLASVDGVADGRPYVSSERITLPAGSWRILDMGSDLTGFLGLQVSCPAPMRLLLTFDEILTGDDVDFKRLGCLNVITFDLEAGDYDLETFEPYTLRYLKLLAVDGAAEIGGLFLRELASPDADGAMFQCSDPQINRIFEAARETYRQNAVDIFMDCPSRERAGWLCDSFFTARTAADLCGHTRIEDNFLQNYLLPERFPFLPNGMLPMCYPSDHNDGIFIPNWAMWFVVQLEEYHERGGDPDLIAALEPRVMALLDYLAGFENADGLLEKLESWVFVEWSRANDFVQDVNYPTNMLYCGALRTAARIYRRPELSDKAARIRDRILKQSFDGEFFVDNAVRERGALRITWNRSETCQYYAFFFGIAEPETHPKLWRRLCDEFGPRRAETGAYPEIHPANAFVGYYLRLELLSRYREQGQILEDIRGYFSHMAERTGTLWEHGGTEASCNHGFASHVAHVLFRDVLGVQVNRRATAVHLSVPDLPLEWCKGRLPVEGGLIAVRWRSGGDLEELSVPEGFDIVYDADFAD